MRQKWTANMQHTLFSASVILLAVVLLIVSNILVGLIPSRITGIDTSSSGLYTLSAQTEQILSEITEDITVYHICAAGKEDIIIPAILDQYTDRSSHVQVVWRDPAAYPNFVSQFTDSELPDNSLIVVNEKGDSCVISFTQLYVADYEEYYASGNVVYEYAVESQLTSAIRLLSADRTVQLYLTGGHGEQDISVSMKEACQQQGMVFHDITLLSLEQIPDECDCLVIFNPQSDFAAEEIRVVEAYLSRGGSIMLVSDYIQGGRPNLESLAERLYGVSACDGVVMESDPDYSMAGYPYYLLPKLVKHGITKPLINGNYAPVVPIAQGLQVAAVLPDGTITEIMLCSSENAYLKDPYTMTGYDWEADDPTGQYALAVAASNKHTDSKMVWFSSAVLWEDEAVRQSSGANQDLVLNSFGWLCEAEDMISIHAKSTYEPRLAVSQSTVTRLSIVLIGIIPSSLIVAGAYVMLSRRRKR